MDENVAALARANNNEELPKELGNDLFLTVSKLTPMVSVELLIQKHDKGERYTLLTWRQDDFYKGWHLPGGVLRFKESIENRIRAVAKTELFSTVLKTEGPIAINEIMNTERDVRGHFISLLYSVELLNQSQLVEYEPDHVLFPGVVSWFKIPPSNLLIQHDIYRVFF